MNQRGRLVVGCGSVCLDAFYNVSYFPNRGGKGFISHTSPFPRISPGGVAFNALAWASLLRAPTALLASLPLGSAASREAALLRDAFAAHGVSDSFVRSGVDRVPTSIVFVDGEERTILMDSAATGSMTPAIVRQHWESVLRHAAIVFTEVSQVPLDAVAEVMRIPTSARRGRSSAPDATHVLPYEPISYLDFDVDLRAIQAAGLGGPTDALRVLERADIVKTSTRVARTLLCDLFSSKVLDSNSSSRLNTEYCAQELHAALGGASMVLVTDGAEGAAGSIKISQAGDRITDTVPALGLKSYAGDTTGCGDAFSGAVLAWLLHNGGLPGQREDVKRMLRAAAAAGFACSRVPASALPLVGAGACSERLDCYRKELGEIDRELEIMLRRALPQDEEQPGPSEAAH